MNRNQTVFIVCLLTFWPSLADAQATFTQLNVSGGGSTRAVSISRDGQFVAVRTFQAGSYRWSPAGGYQLIPNATSPDAQGISGSGNAIVGTHAPQGFGANAFRWTAPGQLLNLGVMTGTNPNSYGMAASWDGSVVVGYGSTFSGQRGFRWTEASGMQSIGVVSGGTGSRAHSVSWDGNVVAGYSTTSSGMKVAVRWTPTTGLTSLGVLPGAADSEANDVSGDGNVIVGGGQNVPAFRWTQAGGMESLGLLPGGIRSVALATSGNGQVIVGTTSSNIVTNQVFVWRQGSGMSSLHSVLVNAGLGSQLNGWILDRAWDVTEWNGKTYIVGDGRFNGQTQGFYAVIPSPVPEPATLTILALGAAALLRRRSKSRNLAP